MRLLYWLRRGDVSDAQKPSMAISDPQHLNYGFTEVVSSIYLHMLPTLSVFIL